MEFWLTHVCHGLADDLADVLDHYGELGVVLLCEQTKFVDWTRADEDSLLDLLFDIELDFLVFLLLWNYADVL